MRRVRILTRARIIRLPNYSPHRRIIYLAIKNLLRYNKNVKITKVKRDTRTFFRAKLCKINYKKLRTNVIHGIGTGYRDNTVPVSSEETSAPTAIENLES